MFTHLANDTIKEIFGQLRWYRDAQALALTCKRFYGLLDPKNTKYIKCLLRTNVSGQPYFVVMQDDIIRYILGPELGEDNTHDLSFKYQFSYNKVIEIIGNAEVIILYREKSPIELSKITVTSSGFYTYINNRRIEIKGTLYLQIDEEVLFYKKYIENTPLEEYLKKHYENVSLQIRAPLYNYIRDQFDRILPLYS